jgi:hypothetical protein
MIHIYCDGGLGNRLLTMFSALYFSKKANRPFIIHWPSNNWCGCNFTDIFANDYNISNFNIKFIDKYVIGKCVLLMHESQIKHGENKIILNSKLSQDNIVKLMVDEPNIFYYGNCLHHSIDSDMIIETINELTISDQILAKISTYNVSDCYGIHIRKTDYGRGLYIREDQLENEVRSNPNRKYFLCSDERSVEMKFKKHNNVLLFEKLNYVERLDANGGWHSSITDNVGRSFNFNVNRTKASSIDAFCDMILLSQTSKRIKTSGSSFLACADLMSKTNILKRG